MDPAAMARELLLGDDTKATAARISKDPDVAAGMIWFLALTVKGGMMHVAGDDRELVVEGIESAIAIGDVHGWWV